MTKENTLTVILSWLFVSRRGESHRDNFDNDNPHGEADQVTTILFKVVYSPSEHKIFHLTPDKPTIILPHSFYIFYLNVLDALVLVVYTKTRKTRRLCQLPKNPGLWLLAERLSIYLTKRVSGWKYLHKRLQAQ